MNTTVINMKTEIFGTEKQTFEIKRTWDESKQECLVLELYPTIAVDTLSVGCLDASTLHLLNHLQEMGEFGSLSVCNLFSMVCANGKPSVGGLHIDEKNIGYLSERMDGLPKNAPVILAWGNSLAKNKVAMEMKMRILQLIQEKGLDKRTKCITSADVPDEAEGTVNLFHPLFMGIRAKEPWQLQDVSVGQLLQEFLPQDKKSQKPENKTKKRGGKNVQNQDEAGL